MGGILVQTKSTTGLISAALPGDSTDQTNTTIDRILSAAVEENVIISFLVFRIDRFQELCYRFSRKKVRSVVAGLLALLLEQTPDDVYIDCPEVNEFFLLLPGIHPKQAEVAGEEIRRRFTVAAKAIFDGLDIEIDLSGAVASFPEDGDNRIELFRKIRETLYRTGPRNGKAIYHVKKQPIHSRKTEYTAVQLERLSKLVQREGVDEGFLLREALDDLLRKYQI